VVVLTILFSAVVAGYESVQRLLNPQPIGHLWAVVAASLVGFVGNEGVALFRIKVGQEIGSAALVADGYHARVDAWISLGVLAGALGVWLGYPLADPILGLVITIAILGIVWESAKAVLERALDGLDPEVLDRLRQAAVQVPGVQQVGEARARWIGHRLHAELNVAVDGDLSVSAAHAVALEVRHQALHRLPHLANVVVHVDPTDQHGEAHHRIAPHAHDGLPLHSH
jgi:cation diffusion facilitator family transporter